MTGLSEQETIFRWAADETEVSVWTAQRRVKAKLERAGFRPFKLSLQRGQEVGWFYKLPLAEFHWRTGKKRAGVGSPAAKAALAAFNLARQRPPAGRIPG